MRRLWFKKHVIAGLAVVVAATAAPLVAYAQPVRAQGAQMNAPQHPETAQATASDKQTAQTTTVDKKGTAQTHLADAKLKACQQREKAITNIMSRLSDRGTKQLDVFSKIADRTEAFYAKSGKTLTNYDTLVNAVMSSKTEAVTAVSSVKSDSTTFSCDGTDPKGMAANFKDKLKTEITALNSYKTAIKNLIVGVKSVQSTDAHTTTAPATTDGKKQ